jgi:hypothetical protein
MNVKSIQHPVPVHAAAGGFSKMLVAGLPNVGRCARLQLLPVFVG